MEFKDLIGLHELSGVEITTERVKVYEWSDTEEDCQVMKFILDGKKYMAHEDPNDGYRSTCGDLKEYDGEIKNTFIAQKVECKMKPNGYYDNDILQMFDIITEKLVLEVGTSDFNDYYPCCEMSFNPENMAINAER